MGLYDKTTLLVLSITVEPVDIITWLWAGLFTTSGKGFADFMVLETCITVASAAF